MSRAGKSAHTLVNFFFASFPHCIDIMDNCCVKLEIVKSLCCHRAKYCAHSLTLYWGLMNVGMVFHRLHSSFLLSMTLIACTALTTMSGIPLKK